MEFNTYYYKAKVVSIYDGDTVKVVVDLGFGISSKLTLRLLGINTPELRGEEREEGLVSRDYLRGLILDKDIYIETFKDRSGKYGRMLATIYYDDMDINEHMINEGYAKKYI